MSRQKLRFSALFKNVIAALMVSFAGVGNSVYAADPPKEQLPALEQTLPEDVTRGPKVITNPAPSKQDKLGATKIEDATPSTEESVKESPLPTTIEVTTPVGHVRKVDRKTLALALGGGGARGAAHIGVLRVLQQEKIPIDYIVGNSMGAIIGGLYSAGVELDKLEEIGSKGGFRKHYVPGILLHCLVLPGSKLVQPFRKSKFAGVWSGDKFERYLAKMIPPGKEKIEDLNIPFSSVATNLIDGKAYRISEGSVARAIRASSSISPLLKPVKIDDKVYVDGGMRANLPASAAKDTGADVIVAVLVDEPLHKVPESRFHHYDGITGRLGDILLAVTDEHQLQFADIVINPDVSNISILSNSSEDTQNAIRAGEEAARKALPAIRKKLGLPEGSQIVDTSEPSL